MTELIASCRIPVDPPQGLSANALRHLSGWRRQAVVGLLRTASAYAARASAPATPYAGPVSLSVTIARSKGRKRMDFDSAVTSTKPMTDGLTDAGWMKDDSQVVAMRIRQIRDLAGEGWIDVAMRQAPDNDVWP